MYHGFEDLLQSQAIITEHSLNCWVR